MTLTRRRRSLRGSNPSRSYRLPCSGPEMPHLSTELQQLSFEPKLRLGLLVHRSKEEALEYVELAIKVAASRVEQVLECFFAVIVAAVFAVVAAGVVERHSIGLYPIVFDTGLEWVAATAVAVAAVIAAQVVDM